jgi:hypothetical protein
MIIWIKRCARILAMSSFFLVFFLSVDPADPFDKAALCIAFLKGCVGALMFWAVGFILADIVIKGLVIGMHTEKSDTIEGGVLQRLYEVQSGTAPEAESRARSRTGLSTAAGGSAENKK